MADMDYEIRKDGNPYVFCAESESELVETSVILEEYPYIQKAMSDENYKLKNLNCFIFREILFENKVVGFATYDILNNFHLILTECYILPEFRGNRLFFDEICKMHFSAPNFGIQQPTRNVIELLMDYAFARKVTDDIVVSAIDLFLDPFDTQSNKKEGLVLLRLPPSNFYDEGICSTIFINGDEVFYHELLRNDRKNGHKRKKLNKGYFSGIIKLFSKNHDEFEEEVFELKNELPDNRLGYDVIVGYGNGLSEYMQGLVDREVLSYDHAVEIRKQLIEEYNSGKIDDGIIEDRFNTLSLSKEVLIGNYRELKELVTSGEFDDEEGAFEELVEIIGDNDELGEKCFNAMLTGNEAELSEMLNDHLENNVMHLGILDDDIDYANSDEYARDYLESRYRLNYVDYSNPSSLNHDWEIFIVLEALDYGDNYYDALNGIFLESLVSPESITDFLIKSNFIKKTGIIEVDWIDGEDDFPKPYLMKILYDHNLETEGSKEELLKRLADNNITLGDAYEITSQGKGKLKELEWIGFYDNFLNDFDFIDFSRYRENHKGNIKEISLDYLNEHIRIARKNNDETYLESCRDSMDDILEDDEFPNGN